MCATRALSHALFLPSVAFLHAENPLNRATHSFPTALRSPPPVKPIAPGDPPDPHNPVHIRQVNPLPSENDLGQPE